MTLGGPCAYRGRMVRHRSALLLAAAFVALSSRADALPLWPSSIDPYGKVELGVAFPLNTPQSDYFGPGFAGRLNLGLGIGEWFGVQLTGQMAVLPARAAAPMPDPAVPIGLGAGIRIKLPYRFPVYPWIDADALYVRTGPLDRFGFTIGLGLHVPIGDSRAVRLGPFLRYFQIVDGDAPMVDSTNAKILIAGASLEIGIAHPKTKDRDRDGVLDAADKCPDDPGTPATQGCPDPDQDGVIDPDDKCPDKAGTAATGGCPDRDKDGVVDEKDKCPDQAGTAPTEGCPDQDGDAVVDSQDKCPKDPGSPFAFGCPDRDGDGIADPDDACPDLAGVPERGGCPVPRAELTDKSIDINDKVYFATDSAEIAERSYAILDEVVRVLKENPKVRVRVEGHTDDRAMLGYDNQKLSERRAESVKQYLVNHGVASKRLQSKGWGPDKPLAPNDSDEGRERNRRVEFVLIPPGEK